MFYKKDRSTFKYWFAHWCAYQMTALNLGIWKWKYLLHDIEKPWLRLWFILIGEPDPYKRVQTWHRNHNRHHLSYWTNHDFEEKYLNRLDIDAMIIDWECSRFTKAEAPMDAYDTFIQIMNKLKAGDYNKMPNTYVIEPNKVSIQTLYTKINFRLFTLKLHHNVNK